MTSERPPLRKRKPSSNPPASEAAPSTDPDREKERTQVQGSWQPPAQPGPAAQLPPAAPRIPRETMRGYAIRPDADSTMQIGSFGGTPTPFPGQNQNATPAGGMIAQAAQAAYPGPIATPAASPTPFPERALRSDAPPPPAQPQNQIETQRPPPSVAPSSDNEPTTFYKRDASGAVIVPGATPSVAPPPQPEPVVEKPPDTARKLSSHPPHHHPSAAPQPAVSRHTARIISDAPPAPTATTSSQPPAPAHRPISSHPPPAAARTVSSNPPPANNRALSGSPTPQGRAPIASFAGDFNPADDVEWQKLWLATQRRAWRSLAVIPAGKEVQTLRVAEALAVLAWHHLGKTIKVFDATHLLLSELESRLSDMSSRVARGESVIVAFGPIVDSPASLSLARATDVALLCVVLGETRIKAAEAAIGEIGEGRFLGSVILDQAGKLQ